jgi:hypothetical protein
LRVKYRARAPLSDFTLGFLVHRSTDGLIVYDGNFNGLELGLESLAVGETAVVDFGFHAHLRRGQYHLDCHGLHNPTHTILGRLCPAGIFGVHETHTRDGVADLTVRPILRERSLSAADDVATDPASEASPVLAGVSMPVRVTRNA